MQSFSSNSLRFESERNLEVKNCVILPENKYLGY